MIDQRALDDLLDAAEAVLRGGEHDGPCANYEGQHSEDYDQHDGCELHAQASNMRRARLRGMVDRLRTGS